MQGYGKKHYLKHDIRRNVICKLYLVSNFANSRNCRMLDTETRSNIRSFAIVNTTVSTRLFRFLDVLNFLNVLYL